VTFLNIWVALWLGILTSISPCPLATNIAAISYIGKDMSSHAGVFASGFAYTLGRVFTYVAIGALLSVGVSSVPDVANFLQRYMNAILGPMLFITGIFLFGFISFNLPGIDAGRFKNLAGKGVVTGPFLLGIIFSLAFCPVSAALFFGSLIPLALAAHSPVIFPTLYGIGTGLPVIIFAFIISFGMHSISGFFKGITRFEKWARYATGVIFVLVGGYYSLVYTFKII
jgi:cytochrome c-type biogenesis protein